MQRVSIIGLGLIGSSIGLGLKRWATKDGKRQSVLEVTGFDISLDVQNYAKKLKAVDRTEWNMSNAISNADLLVIATPVSAVKEIFESVADLGKQGLVVTDTCSTKSEVLQWANEMLPDHIHFVGGHPMAGDTRGVEGATVDMFKDATWCVCPTVNAGDDAVQTVLGLISAVEAEPLFVDPHEHDGYVGGISHLPFMLSVAMTHVVSNDSQWRDMRKLSSSGFKDASRLAAGSPEMYRSICETNGENIVRWLDSTINELVHMRDLVSTGTDETLETLEQIFDGARNARAEWITSERAGGGSVQDTEGEVSTMSVGDQVQQMFFGSLFRRKPRTGREDRTDASRPKRR
ncbi:MAG: prephenate dehydrogenase/arogenate dehydrogenase family protein [Nitrolancea sp.]